LPREPAQRGGEIRARQGSADYVGMLQFGRAGMRVLTLSTREIATVTRATPIRQSRSAAAT